MRIGQPWSKSLPECDHTRGLGLKRNTAVTVCHGCRAYLCSLCGVTIDWHEGIYVTNPVVQWRYCAKAVCVEAEAAYHALPVDEMIRHRGALHAKRVLVHLQDRGIEPRPPYVSPPERLVNTTFVTQDTASGPQSIALRPERVTITPRAFTLDLGEACWCNLGKDCVGSHEIGPISVRHLINGKIR